MPVPPFTYFSSTVHQLKKLKLSFFFFFFSELQADVLGHLIRKRIRVEGCKTYFETVLQTMRTVLQFG
ncbi:hypothetical protein HanRHA438_Chr14g0643551 [Helianthus annuus]|nr:hypothetical protein HanRHA438_Chr14g0643551 [Helianthus annuus]